MARRKTTEEFIQDAKEVHGDKYDYSKVDYKNSRSKVIIICPDHGEFEQIANNHLMGKGCAKCANNIKKTTKEFIQDAKEVHGDKYDYSEVDYINNKAKVTIICPKHGEFEQIARDHLRESGCRKCVGKTTEEFIQDAKEVHGHKYDYSKVDYINNRTKVTIICPEHGEFMQRPNQHLSKKSGCVYCSGHQKTTEQFIQGAKEIHGDRYDYSKVNYKNAKTEITIICPEHGEFMQRPTNHLMGFNCIKCAGIKKRTNKTFIKRAKEVHENKYNYSKVNYKNNKTKITIICPDHGEFRQTPKNHTVHNRGCPECGNNIISKKLRINGSGWSYSNWIDLSKKSKSFTSFKLYIAKLNNKKINKYFYKIGKTFTKINYRFKSIPYRNYEIVYLKESEDGRKICELESKYKRICKEYSYTPNREFGGMYECFESIEPLIEQEDLEIDY